MPLTTLDALTADNAYARLPQVFWTRERVLPLQEPWMVAWSDDAARALGVDPAERGRPETVAALTGARALPWAEPIATAYGGHQFGVWVPRLGDGRAILLGEVRTPSGATWDVQIKGSGPTDFARGFDGRAVLRSALREWLACEALDALGIPTTRALCVISSDTPVQREQTEPGAVIVRLAPTHVRFGTLEHFAHAGQAKHVATLADFVIARDLPELDPKAPDRHARLLEVATARTASLVAAWQAVGFTHGVLNTDNMSIIGLTLDYGPFAFVETFDPAFVPNHSDPAGRYAFDRQPEVAMWNLAQLARALIAAQLISMEQAETVLAGFGEAHIDRYVELMAEKLGLQGWRGEEDEELLQGLLETMLEGGADYTATLRALGKFDPATPGSDASARAAFRDPTPWEGWAAKYATRLRAEGRDPAARRAAMDARNPKFILRTHLAQRAIERAAARDGSEAARLLGVLRRPFDEQPEHEADARPPAADTPPVVLSCSS